MMKVDILKIKGAFTQEVDKKYELGEEVILLIRAQVVKEEVFDNCDGSVNITCILKPLQINVAPEEKLSPM